MQGLFKNSSSQGHIPHRVQGEGCSRSWGLGPSPASPAHLCTRWAGPQMAKSSPALVGKGALRSVSFPASHPLPSSVVQFQASEQWFLQYLHSGFGKVGNAFSALGKEVRGSLGKMVTVPGSPRGPLHQGPAHAQSCPHQVVMGPKCQCYCISVLTNKIIFQSYTL